MIEGLAINGGRSMIARTLVNNWLSPHETVIQVKRGEDMPPDCRRYLFCQGLLSAKPDAEKTPAEHIASLEVNSEWIIRQCQKLIEWNPKARICVIGSESGFTGSYDRDYARAKQLLHTFVNIRRLKSPDQQLVCVAPSIIGDAGMTLRRKDTENLLRRYKEHPKGRFLSSDEVAGLVHHVLYVDQGYLSGVTIRMNGGAHCGHGT